MERRRALILTQFDADAQGRIAFDVSSLAHHGYRANRLAISPSGATVGHIVGALKTVKEACAAAVKRFPEVQSWCLNWCYDGADADAYRRKVLPSYKANRPKDEFKPVPDVARFLRNLSGRHLSYPRAEADDWIAYLAHCDEKMTVLVTGDSDSWAHISPISPVYDQRKHAFVTVDDIKKKYGTVHPAHVAVTKVFLGDTTDGIPRVLRGLLKKQVEEAVAQAPVEISTNAVAVALARLPDKTMRRITFEAMEANRKVVFPLKVSPDMGTVETEGRRDHLLRLMEEFGISTGDLQELVGLDDGTMLV